MLAILDTAVVSGLRGELVRVEVDVAPGLPGCQIVGLPDASLSEARERVRSADPQRRLHLPAVAHHREPGPGRPAQARRCLRRRHRHRHPARLGADPRLWWAVGAAGRALARRRRHARDRRPAHGRDAQGRRAPSRLRTDAEPRGGRARRGRGGRRRWRDSTMWHAWWPARAVAWPPQHGDAPPSASRAISHHPRGRLAGPHPGTTEETRAVTPPPGRSWPTCAASSTPAGPWRSRWRAATTCCCLVHRAPARPSWRGPHPDCCRH